MRLAALVPAATTDSALLVKAADPATRSPIRLAAAGPRWNEPVVSAPSPAATPQELAAMDADFTAGGLRVTLQRQRRRATGDPATVSIRTYPDPPRRWER